eukprot:g6030.t1
MNVKSGYGKSPAVGINNVQFITLYNGGSLSIQATNSHYMCILLMSKDGDWTDAAPECTWNSGGTSIICKYGDKYTYSQGLEPTFTPASQSEKTTLKVQACGASSLYDTHGEVLTFNVYTPVMKNAHCIPNKPLTVRLPLMEYGSDNINHFGAKKTNTFIETDTVDAAGTNIPAHPIFNQSCTSYYNLPNPPSAAGWAGQLALAGHSIYYILYMDYILYKE